MSKVTYTKDAAGRFTGSTSTGRRARKLEAANRKARKVQQPTPVAKPAPAAESAQRPATRLFGSLVNFVMRPQQEAEERTAAQRALFTEPMRTPQRTEPAATIRRGSDERLSDAAVAELQGAMRRGLAYNPEAVIESVGAEISATVEDPAGNWRLYRAYDEAILEQDDVVAAERWQAVALPESISDAQAIRMVRGLRAQERVAPAAPLAVASADEDAERAAVREVIDDAELKLVEAQLQRAVIDQAERELAEQQGVQASAKVQAKRSLRSRASSALLLALLTPIVAGALHAPRAQAASATDRGVQRNAAGALVAPAATPPVVCPGDSPDPDPCAGSGPVPAPTPIPTPPTSTPPAPTLPTPIPAPIPEPTPGGGGDSITQITHHYAPRIIKKGETAKADCYSADKLVVSTLTDAKLTNEVWCYGKLDSKRVWKTKLEADRLAPSALRRLKLIGDDGRPVFEDPAGS